MTKTYDMDRLKERKSKLFWVGMIVLAILPGGQDGWAKTYSIQIGAFQKIQNAERQFKWFKRSVPPHLTDFLRIEKTGNEYVIKVGKLDDPEQALKFLSVFKEYAPDAFIRTGDEIQKNRAEGLSKEEKGSPSGTKNIDLRPKTEKTLSTNQVSLIGTIREISSFPPEQLGLPPGKGIYRIILKVESTKAIQGGSDFMKEKEGDLLSVFSELDPSLFRPGHKIRGVVEYRGNRLSRYYWIQRPQAVTP